MPKFTVEQFEKRALESLERRRQRREQPQGQGIAGVPPLQRIREITRKRGLSRLPKVER